jgi:hypothetical protein
MAGTMLGSCESIEKHIDQLETLSTALVIPALIVLFAAADTTKEVEILGIHLATAEAYGLTAAVYDCLLLLFATASWKAGDLLKSCAPEEAQRAIIAVSVHKWVLNPFSYSGKSPLSLMSCAVGPALLTFVWWLGLMSLRLLASVSHDIGGMEKVLQTLYVVLGLTAILSIGRFFAILLDASSRAGSEGLPTISSLKRSAVVKALFCIISSGLGYWLYYAFGHIA